MLDTSRVELAILAVDVPKLVQTRAA